MKIKDKIYELLSDLEMRTSEEIAEKLGIKLATIRQTLYRDTLNTFSSFERVYKDGSVYYYTLKLPIKSIKARIKELKRLITSLENETT